YSFVSEQQLAGLGLDPTHHLKLKNPLSIEQAYLRSSMLPSHLSVLTRNRTYAKEFGFYELSRVFHKKGRGEQPDEPTHLAITIIRQSDAYKYLKGILDAVAWDMGLDVSVAALTEPAPGYAKERVAAIKRGGHGVGLIDQ